jgi:Family of unknown function (DUF6188)
MDSAVVKRLEELHGATVTQVRVDHALTLLLAGPDVAAPPSLLIIGGSFSCRDSTGVEQPYADDYARATLGPALELFFNQTVAAASVSAVGELALDFLSGAGVRIPPNPHFEAWSLSALGMATLVSPPGGGLPAWPIKEYRSADS